MDQKGSCSCCHEFMVPMIGDGSEVGVLDWSELPGWRCINCGERVDPLILANRRGAEEEGMMKDKRFRSGVNGHDRGGRFLRKDFEIVRTSSADEEIGERMPSMTGWNDGGDVWSIVLAGGEGERMKPLVQRWLGRHRPKQYCTFVGTRSMFQHTVDRAADVTGLRKTVIGTADTAW
ncbi:MAG: hypothetical protein LV473_00735 [Nitrospira sp.]|nr:hypothetical protein [Nitrospira sp.]